VTTSLTWFMSARPTAEQNLPPSVYQQSDAEQSATCTPGPPQCLVALDSKTSLKYTHVHISVKRKLTRLLLGEEHLSANASKGTVTLARMSDHARENLLRKQATIRPYRKDRLFRGQPTLWQPN